MADDVVGDERRAALARDDQGAFHFIGAVDDDEAHIGVAHDIGGGVDRHSLLDQGLRPGAR